MGIKVSCAAASFKMDHLRTERMYSFVYLYPSAVYCGGTKPEDKSYSITMKGMERGGIVSSIHTDVFLILKALYCFVLLSPSISSAQAIRIAK